jgi:hypothetical protein
MIVEITIIRPRGYNGEIIGGAAEIALLQFVCSSDINHEFGKIMPRLTGTDTGCWVLFSDEEVCLTSHQEGKKLHKLLTSMGVRERSLMGTHWLRPVG